MSARNEGRFGRDHGRNEERRLTERRTDSDRQKERTGDSRRSRSPSRHHRRSKSRSRSPRRRSHSPPARRDEDSGRNRGRSRSRDDVRSKLNERSRHSRSRSHSVASTSSESSSQRRHKKTKGKHKQHRSGSRERSKKDRKKEKKDKKKKKLGAIGHQWGKYGIINETDLYNKEQEFRAWLVEERKINPETITKEQNKKEFAHFVEDYNTATLPHEKFYHMEAYERRMSALRSGEFVPPPDDGYDPAADMRALEGAHKRKAVERETYMSKEQLMELRRVQHERIEAGKMKLLGMDIKQNMGVRMDGTMFDG